VPTRKQRRRRQKGRRHEYEYVYVDDEGREVDPDEVEEAPSRNGARKPARAQAARGGRPLQPASWRRVVKRGLLFAPFMFLLITFLSPELTTTQTLAQTVFLLLIFLPFSYVMDSITYRMITKRQAKLEAGSRSAPKR
jgi:Flp pilus assembly protein TadB